MKSLSANEYFDKLERLRPYIFDYAEELIQHFEIFLNRPIISNLTPILNPSDRDIAESAYNTLLHVRRIRRISNVVMKEMENGFTIFTNGSSSYVDAINKYCQTIFMVRRHAFLSDSISSQICEQAVCWILDHRISPIMLSYIIKNELIGIPADAMSYWYNIFLSLNRNYEAVALLKV